MGMLEEFRITGMKGWTEGNEEDRQPAIHPELFWLNMLIAFSSTGQGHQANQG
jgi:hypothetical protein